MRFDDPRFNNPICKKCIKDNIAKYGSFNIRCEGITTEDDVDFALKNGFDEHSARWLYDNVYFFDKVYGKPARDYQVPILYCTAKRIVGRQCRQTGKTLSITQKLLKFATTNEKKTVLILAPTEKQIKKIWDEYIWRDGIDMCPEIKESVVSSSQKPYYNVKFGNDSSILLMIANEGARGQTADIIYIDEAAIIGAEMLNSIMMTIASKAENAVIYLTSTPKGRGNYFYRSCKEFSQYKEFHVSIDDVPQMHAQRDEYKELLGETGYMQECMADFPDASGGPFSFSGIAKAKTDYRYENCTKEPGYMYFGGVDWNGPNIGTYFYIIGFNPDTMHIKVFDKIVIASATWNSITAKNTLLELNAKWKPKAWMCDYGYGHSIVEEIRFYSMNLTDNDDPAIMLKSNLESVEFGGPIEIEDPFTKEMVKKTTRSFIVSQVSKLFEVRDGHVPISLPKYDKELIDSLEKYKLLTITDKGVEKYGFAKDDNMEDHCIDAFMLALYGIVKNYSELFKKIVLYSRLMSNEVLIPTEEGMSEQKIYAGSIVLLTDNHPETIMLDERKINKYDPDNRNDILISRSINRTGTRRQYANGSLYGIMRTRGGRIKRTID